MQLEQNDNYTDDDLGTTEKRPKRLIIVAIYRLKKLLVY